MDAIRTVSGLTITAWYQDAATPAGIMLKIGTGDAVQIVDSDTACEPSLMQERHSHRLIVTYLDDAGEPAYLYSTDGGVTWA